MKFRDMTPHELAQKTVKDITERRKLAREGQKQALDYSMDNRQKIQRRLSHCRY